jgi:hypothetical protein
MPIEFQKFSVQTWYSAMRDNGGRHRDKTGLCIAWPPGMLSGPE